MRSLPATLIALTMIVSACDTAPAKKGRQATSQRDDDKDDEPSKSPQRAAFETNSEFLEAVMKPEFGASDFKTHDEASDPNKLLGRPGQYISKVNFKVAGDDGTLEIFTTTADAAARAEYVRNIGRNSPALLQYVYLNEKRMAVLRLPKQLEPTKAKRWEEMLRAL